MKSKNKSKRGDLANRQNPKTENKKNLDLEPVFNLLHVTYRDHVQFKNCNSITMRPCIREAIGWYASESSSAICICSDRPAKSSTEAAIREGGLVILKEEILQIIEIPFDNFFNCICESIIGTINP